jgi:hypothetical protein
MSTDFARGRSFITFVLRLATKGHSSEVRLTASLDPAPQRFTLISTPPWEGTVADYWPAIVPRSLFSPQVAHDQRAGQPEISPAHHEGCRGFAPVEKPCRHGIVLEMAPSNQGRSLLGDLLHRMRLRILVNSDNLAVHHYRLAIPLEVVYIYVKIGIQKTAAGALYS